MIIKDQLGNAVSVSTAPYRIVSLVPSLTELVVHLGLEQALVGITKFCVFPDHLRKDKIIVGGTKKVNYERIAALQPTIILCNKEENTKEIVTTLATQFAVHVSMIASISDALELIAQYGVLFDVAHAASELIRDIKHTKSVFTHRLQRQPHRKVLYFIWKSPWMLAGRDTFIDHMLSVNGFTNLASATRYPEIAIESLMDYKEVTDVFLSSEPYPFQERHVAELREVLPASVRITLVDGTYFSWYGSRIKEAFAYFTSLYL